MASRYPFLNVLYDLIEKIAEAQNVELNDNNRHYAIGDFARRKNTFFPEDELIDSTLVLKRDAYLDIREKLARARCDFGFCLSASDLRRLDAAYADYMIEADLPIARIASKIPHATFGKIVQRHGLAKKHLSDVRDFRKVLADEVMGLFWQGKKSDAYKNAEAVRTALVRRHEVFAVPEDDWMLWDDLLLGVAGFCRLVEGGGFHNEYIAVLCRRQGKREDGFRSQQLLQLQHFEDPKNLASSRGLSALMSGHAGLYGELEGGFMKIRAACSAIEVGCALDSKPPFLEDYSVEDLMKEGLDELGKTATLQAKLNCKAYLLRAHALKGSVLETVGGAANIRGECGAEKVGPHLEAMLLLNEALAYGNVKGDGEYMEALAGKTMQLRSLSALNSVPSIWQFDREHIEKLEQKVIAHGKKRTVHYSRKN